ncbi:hypothetical protein, partial [Campylobacter concisus]|uniref:hypothetical protein n=1 Tax=Campylobacter concisus TaxID=199 RepID=UPI00112FB33B
MTLTADKNGDGLISIDEIGDGTSKVEINLPRTIKPNYKHTKNSGGHPTIVSVNVDGPTVQDK